MPAAYERCVRKVRRRKGTRSAHAICTKANAGNVKQQRKRKARRKRKR